MMMDKAGITGGWVGVVVVMCVRTIISKIKINIMSFGRFSCGVCRLCQYFCLFLCALLSVLSPSLLLRPTSPPLHARPV